MWRVVQAMKVVLSMGHIVIRLAYYFASFDVTKQELEPLELKFFDEVYLMKAEIITQRKELEDVTSQRCYMLHQNRIEAW